MNKSLSDKDITYRRAFTYEELVVIGYLVQKEYHHFKDTSAIRWADRMEQLWSKIDRMKHG